MNALKLARAMVATAADIIVMDDQQVYNDQVAEFLEGASPEQGAVFGAMATLVVEALGMLNDRQRAEYWRKVDKVVAMYDAAQ